MADDPNRDILPVKDDSFCGETCRSSIDPRERHFIYKLDRYELEDKYLRLLEEANTLKKLSNCQEDKIKRLATKLMRVTTNPRACTVALDIYDDKKKIIGLELENTKLKDKIVVLRNQLLSHTIVNRSSSRSRNPQTRPSSGRITCRSESSRSKIPSCHCIVRDGSVVDTQRSNKIEELEAQRKEMAYRIAQLEKELSVNVVTSQREKNAENVEYIRVWRQMKQLNDKLIVAQNTNDSLNLQINDLERQLEETTKNNKDISAALLTEQQRVLEADEQILKVKDSQTSAREKDDQIQDLANEVKILQQHNSELAALCSKCGEVEQENLHLKKKVSEQQHDQETLQSVVSTEQANIVALQNSNEHLLGKLQELQKDIDTLTTFQVQAKTEDSSNAKQTDSRILTDIDEMNVMQLKCKKCCDEREDVEKTAVVTKGSTISKDNSAQTEHMSQQSCRVTKDQGTTAMTPTKEEPKEEDSVPKQNIEQTKSKTSLTPKKMITLLDQAQISTHSNKSSRVVLCNEYSNDIVGSGNERHSETNTTAEEIPTSPKYPPRNDCKCITADQSMDAQMTNFSKMLSFLFDLFRGCPGESKLATELSASCRPKSQCPRLDVLENDTNDKTKDSSNCNKSTSTINNKTTCNSSSNNGYNSGEDNGITKEYSSGVQNIQYFETDKILKLATSYVRTGCSTRRYCSGLYNRRQEKLKRNVFSTYKRRNQDAKYDDGNCTCDALMSCPNDSSCGNQCCNPSKHFNSKSVQYDLPSLNTSKSNTSPSQNNIFQSSVQNNAQSVGTMYITCKLQDEFGRGPYRPMEKNMDVNDDTNMLYEYVKHLDKCKELLNNNCPVSNVLGTLKETESRNLNRMRYRLSKESWMPATQKESCCSLNCPNDCGHPTNIMFDSFPLVITDGQGLMELHIVSLQLSTSAKQILFQENDINNVSLFINWNIWNQETTSTPNLAVSKSCKLSFNSSFVYRIPDLFSFFNYILHEFVQFQVNVHVENSDDYTVATGKLSMKDMLDYPQNKLEYIAPVNSVLPCSLGTNFGQLSLWVKLSCNVEKVKDFRKKRGLLHDEFPEDSRQSSITVKRSSSIKGDNFTNDENIKTATLHRASVEKEYFPAEVDTDHLISEAHEPVTPSMKYIPPSADAISADDYMIAPNNKEDQSGFDSEPFAHRLSESNEQRRSSDSLTVMKSSMIETNMYEKSFDSLGIEKIVPKKSSLLHVRKIQEKKEIPAHGERELDTSAKPKKGEDEEKKGEETQTETSSVVEFNAVIADKHEEVAEDDSDDSIYEMSTVFSEKNWEEFRRRSWLTFTNTLKTEDQSDEEKAMDDDDISKDTIVIEILEMILLPKTSIMENNDIQLLYIEFSFLGYCGADMETISMIKPKPPVQKMTYNFRKTFQVDPKRNSVQDNILLSMLHDSGSSNIKFIVVCEPVPEETDTMECLEIGYALLNIRKHALGDTEGVVSLPIYTPDDKENIGFLKIFISGVDIIRQRLARRSSSNAQ